MSGFGQSFFNQNSSGIRKENDGNVSSGFAGMSVDPNQPQSGHVYGSQDLYGMGSFNRSPSSNTSGELLSMLHATSTRPGDKPSRPLDMSEFPALASRVANVSLTPESTPGALSMAEIANMRAPMPKQEEFVMEKEDFPALPGFQKSSGQEPKSKMSSANDVMVQQGQQSNSSTTIGSKLSHQPKNEPTCQLDGSSFPRFNVGAASMSQSLNDGDLASKEGLNGKYGLLGLLSVVRMANKDLNTLALGMDLTTLGFNLNSTESLYSTFGSPWTDAPSTKEPQYNLPICYYMQPPALKTSHLSKFQLETLFYVFYAMPKDVLQTYAAQELYSREWKYHKELKLWFKRATQTDGLGNPRGAQYIYFDINTWEKRLFSANIHGGVEAGFLSEEEVRVQFSGQTSS